MASIEILRGDVLPWLRHELELLLESVLEAEVDAFLADTHKSVDGGGRRRFVRNGYVRPRPLKSAVGRLVVRVPRIRDRLCLVRVISRFVPPYVRSVSGSAEDLLACYLQGLQSGNLDSVLTVMCGSAWLRLPATVRDRQNQLWARWQDRLNQTCLTDFQLSRVIAVRTQPDKDAPPVVVAIGSSAGQSDTVLAVLPGCPSRAESMSRLAEHLSRRGLACASKSCPLPVEIVLWQDGQAYFGAGTTGSHSSGGSRQRDEDGQDDSGFKVCPTDFRTQGLFALRLKPTI